MFRWSCSVDRRTSLFEWLSFSLNICKFILLVRGDPVVGLLMFNTWKFTAYLFSFFYLRSPLSSIIMLLGNWWVGLPACSIFGEFTFSSILGAAYIDWICIAVKSNPPGSKKPKLVFGDFGFGLSNYDIKWLLIYGLFTTSGSQCFSESSESMRFPSASATSIFETGIVMNLSFNTGLLSIPWTVN